MEISRQSRYAHTDRHTHTQRGRRRPNLSRCPATRRAPVDATGPADAKGIVMFRREDGPVAVVRVPWVSVGAGAVGGVPTPSLSGRWAVWGGTLYDSHRRQPRAVSVHSEEFIAAEFVLVECNLLDQLITSKELRIRTLRVAKAREMENGLLYRAK